MRKLFFIFILALVCGISVWAQDYDFSAVSESEHTLYYNVTSSTAPYAVEVSGGDNVSGSLIIPSEVTNNEITYSVVSIGETAVCNVENFAPGIYFVRISGNDGSVIQRKFVKE